MYSREDKIFVRINKMGYIPYIGMCGPIPNPIKIPTATCLQMVTAGIEVFEVNPDTKEMVKLTVQNVFDDNKFEKKPAPAVHVKTPVAPPVNNVTFTGVKTPDVNPVNVSDEKQELSEETKTDEQPEQKESASTNEEESTDSSEEKNDDATEVKPQQQNNDFKNKNKNKNKK